MSQEDKNPVCYVAMDDMGNVLGAVVCVDSRRESCAAYLAAWIMDGLHIMPMAVEDVRVSFRRDVEGPRIKPVEPYHVRIVTQRNGKLISQCEGESAFFEDHDDFEDDEPHPIKEKYEAKEFANEQAANILDLLLHGKDDWRRIRTLGDIDTLRLQISGVLS